MSKSTSSLTKTDSKVVYRGMTVLVDQRRDRRLQLLQEQRISEHFNNQSLEMLALDLTLQTRILHWGLVKIL
jgi:hypothetical protein